MVLLWRGSDCVFVAECWNVDPERRRRIAETVRSSFCFDQVYIDGLLHFSLSFGSLFVGFMAYLRLRHFSIDVCLSSVAPSGIYVHRPLRRIIHVHYRVHCPSLSLSFPFFINLGGSHGLNLNTAPMSVHSFSLSALAVEVLYLLRSSVKVFDFFTITS